MTSLCLQVSVPCCGFRQSRAREYAETYPIPPLATVYGFLLALVSEENRYAHERVRLALALKRLPEQSTILRKIRRVKKIDLTEDVNSRPDFQELLTQLNFLLWINSDEETAQPNLTERVRQALMSPESIHRYGALSLGESRDLVNEVSILKENPEGELLWLSPEEDGIWSLPCWVDHVGSADTHWQRYSVVPGHFREPQVSDWSRIESPMRSK